MSCNECKHSPQTYEEYCIGQKDPNQYCPDAFSEKSHLCGNYNKEKEEEKDEEIKEELEI